MISDLFIAAIISSYALWMFEGTKAANEAVTDIKAMLVRLFLIFIVTFLVLYVRTTFRDMSSFVKGISDSSKKDRRS